MTQDRSISLFIARLAISFVVLFAIYIVYGPAKDVEVEMINEFLYLFIIPAIFIPATIVACLLAGLPIRFIPALNRWWYSNSYVAIIGLALGLFFIYLSPNFTHTIKVTQNATEIIKKVPDDTVFAIGWSITAFFLLHCYPMHFIESVIKIFKKDKQDLDWSEKW